MNVHECLAKFPAQDSYNYLQLITHPFDGHAQWVWLLLIIKSTEKAILDI